MGFRTVAVFLNDFNHELRNDPHAGERIGAAINGFHMEEYRPGIRDFHYGRTVAQSHVSDIQVLVVHDYDAFDIRDDTETPPSYALLQMQHCLERNGYRVTKKRTSKTVSFEEGRVRR